VGLQAQSRCVHGRPLLALIYRWPGLEDPVGFDTDPLYMTVYNTTLLFDCDYTLTSILGLCFYGPLPEQTSGVLIQRALVVIPLSVRECFNNLYNSDFLYSLQLVNQFDIIPLSNDVVKVYMFLAEE
jgi:hypothetical protein